MKLPVLLTLLMTCVPVSALMASASDPSANSYGHGKRSARACG